MEPPMQRCWATEGISFLGCQKKGILPMEPLMERVGDRAIVMPRGVQKVRPSDFDATRPSDFDATLGRWSLPPCLPRQSTLPSQVSCPHRPTEQKTPLDH